MTGEGILVRDCMEWKIHKVAPYIRQVRNDAERDRLLRKKLIEECGEVLTADTRQELAEELADVLDVAFALARSHGLLGDVLMARRAKRAAKGGFDGGIVLAWRQPDE